MSRGSRIVLVVALVCASAPVLLAGAGAVMVYSDGMIDVHVQEKDEDGANIHLMVPTSLVRIVLAFVPLAEDMRPGPETRAYWPLIEAACDGIARSPDGVFVEVEGPDEHVVVQKSGGRLIVDVDDREARVHVSVPLRAVDFVVRRLRPVDRGWGPKASISITGKATRAPGAPRA